MAKEEDYQLLYNDIQGGFHFNDYTWEPNINNWMELGSFVAEKHCIRFTKQMERKYPGIKYSGDPKYKTPTITVIRFEFQEYCHKHHVSYGLH